MAKSAKKAAPKKAAAKKSAPVKPVTVNKEKAGPGKIEQIIELHKKGKANTDIVAAGFNKTTVAIQVAKYKKDPKKWEAAHKK